MKPLYRPPLETSALLVKTGHQKQSAQPASHGTGHQVPNSHSGSISPDPSDFVSLLWTILRNDHGNSNHCNLPRGPVLGERCARIQCFILLQLKHSEALEPKLPAAFVLVAYAIRELNWESAPALVLKLYHGQFNWKACVYPGVLSLILDLLFLKIVVDFTANSWFFCRHTEEGMEQSSLQMLSRLTSSVQESTPRKSPEYSAGKLRFPLLILLMDSMSCPIC